ncbi:ABC transporter permease [Actinocorallia sp. A-T 12471]|uniref:ABC transporter permease n=1 Tax=Actinocorallia sp. A-T 12471 TaxID=3089813 RepID=UPI0029D22E68|nr:ABC transporter permease [Actinocorallia sp. A-T 12471]MDX6740801.1 ABC transporter permease [Actinocorallia sp. A-T 12471]
MTAPALPRRAVLRLPSLRGYPPLDRAAFATVGLLLFVVAFGPLLAPHDPYSVDLGRALLPPSAEHWFGTDASGRDVLSRVLVGARPTILGSLTAVVASALIGVTVAAVATLSPRWLDEALMRICDVALSLPIMVMALGISVALGPSLRSAIIAMLLSWWPSFARLARAEMRTTMAATYVEAARITGVSRWRLMTRHVLPNSLDSVYVQVTLEIGGATLIMAGLSFVGAGAQPPSAEWGAMVETGSRFLTSAWWTAVVPGAVIALTALAFALAGDALRARTDGREAR